MCHRGFTKTIVKSRGEMLRVLVYLQTSCIADTRFLQEA